MGAGTWISVLVALVAVFYGLMKTPNRLRDAILGLPPANSSLATYSWPAPRVLTEEEITEFHVNGFLVLRQVVDPAVVDLMLQEAEPNCAWQLLTGRSCYLRQTRWFVDLFRDFLFHGPVGAIAHQVIRGEGVRVVQDGVFGVRNTWNPFIFSYIPHVDHGGNPGVYGRLHSNASGVSVWMPLQDIDQELDGGSIVLYDKFPAKQCHTLFGSVVTDNSVVINMSTMTAKCHLEALKLEKSVLSFRKGDLVLWSPNMLHNTQAVVRDGFVRYAWHAQLVDSDSVSCFVRDCWNRGEACCSGRLPGPGEKIHTPCYAQVHPSPLAEELAAHFGDAPQPLITWRPDKKIPTLEVNHSCGLRHKVVA